LKIHNRKTLNFFSII